MTQTVATIAQALQADFFGDGDLVVTGLAEPADACTRDLALAMSPRYADALAASDAQAAVVWDGADWEALGLKAALVVPRARMAMSALTQMMDAPRGAPGIHPSAVIDPSAQIGERVAIGPFCVIGADAVIGEGIGKRAILHPNAVVGSDGFSFVTETPCIAETGRRTLGKTPFALAGSTIVGDRCILGGKAGVADHITLGSDVLLGGAAVILSDVPAGSFMLGYPAKPMLQFRTEQRAVRDLVSKPKRVT